MDREAQKESGQVNKCPPCENKNSQTAKEGENGRDEKGGKIFC